MTREVLDMTLATQGYVLPVEVRGRAKNLFLDLHKRGLRVLGFPMDGL